MTHFFRSIKTVFCMILWLPLVTQAAVVVEHELGQTTINQTPKRIVTLYQGATDVAVALGVTPVGAVESWSEKPMYTYLRPKLNGVQYVGLETQPSLEDISVLKPDLIVATTYRHEKIYPMLKKIAPTIVLGENVGDFKTTLALMGKALGKQSTAQQIEHDFAARLTALKAKLHKKFGGVMPTISVISIRGDHIRPYPKQGFAGIVLEELGFKFNANDAERTKYRKLKSFEAIPTINSDYFFVFMRAKPAVLSNYEKWRNHPLWKRTRAYKNKHVFEVSSVYWSLAGGILSANKMLDEVESIFFP